MTAILGVFGAAQPDEGALRRMLGALSVRGADAVHVHREPGASLVVTHHGWERGANGAATPGFAADSDRVVVADASLHYVKDLRRMLPAGSVRRDASPSALVLAACRVFGEECLERLEGELAFVVWNRRARTVLAGRDFAGRRPLYLADAGGGSLVVTSTIGAALAHPGVSTELDAAAIGADAAGLIFSRDDETAYRAVRVARAGWIATWSEVAGVRTRRAWRPRAAADTPRGFDEAADALRALLTDAVRERMAGDGATSIWMSGGRDSTAVFAAGQALLRERPELGPLLPVSRSHPPGDSGREDEAIAAVAAHWNVAPHWISAADVRMLEGARVAAAARAEPFAQPFERLTRAIAAGSRAVGSRVALDGYGGDFLFQISEVYLADLLSRGRVRDALRDWRVLDGGREGWRGFVRWAVQPNLPAWAVRAAGIARGRPLHALMTRSAPPWIDAGFLRAHDLVQRGEANGPMAFAGDSLVDRESSFYLMQPYFARINAMMGEFALEQGVELRSPLHDERIVQFALARPREERNDRGDRKRLLRHAVRGLLPEAVLAPRRGKSGTLSTYFAREMQGAGLGLLEQVARQPVLASAGIVDAAELGRALSRYRAERAGYPYVEALFCTLQAELWLRARTHPSVTPPHGSVFEHVGALAFGPGARA